MATSPIPRGAGTASCSNRRMQKVDRTPWELDVSKDADSPGLLTRTLDNRAGSRRLLNVSQTLDGMGAGIMGSRFRRGLGAGATLILLSGIWPRPAFSPRA